MTPVTSGASASEIAQGGTNRFVYDSPAATTTHAANTRARALVAQGVAKDAWPGSTPRFAQSLAAKGAEEGTGVIGKVADLERTGEIGAGERTLLDRLPNQGSPRANWKQNSGVLRQEMAAGTRSVTRQSDRTAN